MRVVYFDITRAIAVVLIVFTHAWSQLVINPDFAAVENTWLLSYHGWFLWQFFHILGRIGVPFFTMLTGALMLGRSYPDIPGFLKGKLPKFIYATLIAAILYGILVHFLFGTSLQGNLHNILMGGIPRADGGGPIGAYHLWYMYMLIGLYISIPFLSRMLSALTQGELVFLILLSFLLVTIPTTLSAGNSYFSYFSAYSFIIQTYALYALLGYWLHKYNAFHGVKISYRIALFFLMIIFTMAVKFYLLYPQTPPAELDTISTYDSIYIYVLSILLFSILRDVFYNTVKLNKFISLLAGTSWSVYLWHLIAVHIVNFIAQKGVLNPFAAVFIDLITGFTLGIAIYFLLHKTKLKWLVQ